MTSKFKADDIQIEELAAFLLGRDLDSFADDIGEYEENLWEEFYDRFDVEQNAFLRLIEALVPLIEVGKSPLTEKIYKGFANTEKKFWLVKIEVEK